MKRAGSSGAASESGVNTKPGRVVVPKQAIGLKKWGAALLFVLERLLTSSLRIQWDDRSRLFDSPDGEPVIYCVWHNRLAFSMAVWRLYPQKRQPSRRLAAMVSASKDGAFLARALENFGVQPVRGSSSRRGAQALLELTSWAERGYDLAITPDGPRGPRYVVQEGVVALAQLTGRPIVPVTIKACWKVSFKSWDRFQLPLPFSRCRVTFWEPVRVGRGASDEERESFRRRLEEQLRAGSEF
jgi:lysophospholipid acyltransferase (LPLAT)-like uncharacterized protein